MPDALKHWQADIQFKLIDHYRIIISEQQHHTDNALIELIVLAEQAKSGQHMLDIVNRLKNKLAAETTDPKDSLVKAVSYRLDYLIKQRSRTNENKPIFVSLQPAATLEEVANMLEQTEYIDWRAYAVKEGITEGLAEGRTKGLAEGRTKGLAEGRTKGLAEGRTKGLAEGRTKGLAEGFEKGMAEGQTKGEQALFLTVLRSRFEQQHLPEWVINKVHAADQQQIEQWTHRLFSAQTLQDMLE